MTLGEASRQALSAAKAGDLEALARALEARAEAIAAGALPTRAIVEDGEQTVAQLQSLMRGLGVDSARLKQFEEAFAAQMPRAPHIDYRG